MASKTSYFKIFQTGERKLRFFGNEPHFQPAPNGQVVQKAIQMQGKQKGN
jgi:hypothetical protein